MPLNKPSLTRGGRMFWKTTALDEGAEFLLQTHTYAGSRFINKFVLPFRIIVARTLYQIASAESEAEILEDWSRIRSGFTATTQAVGSNFLSESLLIQFCKELWRSSVEYEQQQRAGNAGSNGGSGSIGGSDIELTVTTPPPTASSSEHALAASSPLPSSSQLSSSDLSSPSRRPSTPEPKPPPIPDTDPFHVVPRDSSSSSSKLAASMPASSPRRSPSPRSSIASSTPPKTSSSSPNLLSVKAPQQQVPIFHSLHLSIPEIETVIERLGPSCLKARDADGRLPLHVAAENNDELLISLLLKKESSVIGLKDKHGWTALHCAANEGNLGCCEILLEAEAPVLAITKSGSLPLHYLIGYGRRSRLMRKNDSRSSDTTSGNGGTVAEQQKEERKRSRAKLKRLIRVMNTMLERGAPANAQGGTTHNTILHEAALWGCDEVVKLLIEEGARTDLTDKRGETPLHFAARYGRNDVISRLVDAGSPMSVCGSEGTALDVALSARQEESAELLRKFGARMAADIERDLLSMRQVLRRELDSLEPAPAIVGKHRSPTLDGTVFSPSVKVVDACRPQCSPPPTIFQSASTSEDDDSRNNGSSAPVLGERTSRSRGSTIDTGRPMSVREKRRSRRGGVRIDNGKLISENGGGDDGDGGADGHVDGFGTTSNGKEGVRDLEEVTRHPHSFQVHDFHGPTWCDFCGGFIWGIRKQGYVCAHCSFKAHKGDCRKQATFASPCLKHPHAAKSRQISQSAPSSSTTASLPKASLHPTSIPPSPSPPSPAMALATDADYMAPTSTPPPKLSDSWNETIPSVSATIFDTAGVSPSIPSPASTTSTSTPSTSSSTSTITSSSSSSSLSSDSFWGSARARQSISLKDRFSGYFDGAELSTLYDHFQNLDRDQDGFVTAEDFKEALGTIVDTTLAKALFEVFNRCGKTKDKISFEQYVFGICIPMVGSPVEKLKFAFEMYDSKGEGEITFERLSTVVQSVYSSLAEARIVTKSTSDAFTRELFRRLGGNPDSFPSSDTVQDSATTPAEIANATPSLFTESTAAANSPNTDPLSSVVGNQRVITRSMWMKNAPNHLLFIQSLGLLPEESATLVRQANAELQSKGMSIVFGHKDWPLVQSVCWGIRKATGESEGYKKSISVYKAKHYSVQSDHHLLSVSATPNAEVSMRSSVRLTAPIFRDFAPAVFRHLRSLFKVDPNAYMFSLGMEKLFGNLLVGNFSALCGMVSTGRSGSFFLRSVDNRYIIKTLPSSEHSFFRRTLQDFHQHYEQNPSTLMTRFLGMHSLRMDPAAASSPWMHFIVMSNLFDSPFSVKELYDLKGSTVDRHVEVAESDISSIARKDLDFKRTLKLGPMRKALLLEQLEKDCQLLESHNVCDYSLLVGIASLDIRKGMIPADFETFDSDVSIFRKDFGGMLSTDEDELYFVGVIDNLTQYDFSKKSENFAKSFIHDVNEISAIAPKPYRRRFQKFVASIIE